jgi:hypothetical protein
MIKQPSLLQQFQLRAFNRQQLMKKPLRVLEQLLRTLLLYQLPSISIN